MFDPLYGLAPVPVIIVIKNPNKIHNGSHRNVSRGRDIGLRPPICDPPNLPGPVTSAMWQVAKGLISHGSSISDSICLVHGPEFIPAGHTALLLT